MMPTSDPNLASSGKIKVQWDKARCYYPMLIDTRYLVSHSELAWPIIKLMWEAIILINLNYINVWPTFYTRKEVDNVCSQNQKESGMIMIRPCCCHQHSWIVMTGFCTLQCMMMWIPLTFVMAIRENTTNLNVDASFFFFEFQSDVKNIFTQTTPSVFVI